MADYIYTMEIRLTPDQLRGVTLVQDIARAAGMNIYLTGGAVRDIISGFPIRDLDFTVQGNPLKLQKQLEHAGAAVASADDDLKTLYLVLPGNVRAEISTARTERYEKTGKPPIVSPGTIIEDLRRRDFTINAMALSLNPGSRGLLMDPFNGAADIEAKLIRILHNYSFVEDPSRLIRAARFAARFHWPIEERTQARIQSAQENNYIADMRKLIPRKDLVAAWKDLEDNAKDLAKRLTGKEAATPSRTWKLLSEARPEMVLFLEVTARQQAVAQKIKNFFGKWRQVQQKLPLLEMTELRITPPMPEYPKIAHDVFMLLLDGKLHSRTEILKFLKPQSPPPPPPPPPPPKRGRAAKAAASAQPAAVAAAVPGKKKGKGAAPAPPPPPAPKVEVPSPAKHGVEKHASKKAP